MSSSFTTPADLRMLDNYRWLLLAEFAFHVGSFPSDEVIRVSSTCKKTPSVAKSAARPSARPRPARHGSTCYV